LCFSSSSPAAAHSRLATTSGTSHQAHLPAIVDERFFVPVIVSIPLLLVVVFVSVTVGAETASHNLPVFPNENEDVEQPPAAAWLSLRRPQQQLLRPKKKKKPPLRPFRKRVHRLVLLLLAFFLLLQCLRRLRRSKRTSRDDDDNNKKTVQKVTRNGDRRGDYEFAKNLFREMREDQDCQPNAVSYNGLMAASLET